MIASFRSAAVLVATVAAVLAGCTPGPSRTVINTQSVTRLDPVPPIIGFDVNGDLLLSMPGCTIIVTKKYIDRFDVQQVRCVEPLADALLVTPWNRTLRGVSGKPDLNGQATLRFKAEPRMVTLDPLDRRTWKLGEVWRIRHPLLTRDIEWIPSDVQLQPLLVALGPSLGVDVSVAPAVKPPDLAVTSLTATNNELVGGAASVLELSVTNRGEGPAYRVFATVRASIGELHGVQFSFGKIDPGATVRRRVRVSLPENIDETSAMLVLVFQEANGFAPANYSRRVPVRVVATAPRLAVSCTPAAGTTEVDAGEILRLRCTVRNEGGRPATGVTTVASVGGQRAVSRTTDVPPRGSETVDVPVRIPPGAGIDQRLNIEVVAAEAGTGGQRAVTRVPVTIRRPRVCPSGKLSRAEYRTKRAELERARAAGDLTADEFDRYDAELVSCLDE